MKTIEKRIKKKLTTLFATQCFRPLIFQTMNYVRSNGSSLKYQRFASSGCKDIGMRKFEFVAKKTSIFLSAKCVVLAPENSCTVWAFANIGL